MATMTTKDNFPVIDVTHRPKRMQGTNLKTLNDHPQETVAKDSNVPQTVTLERAIVFYETHAEGEHKVLYSQTAKWLREFMSRTVSTPNVGETNESQEILEDLRGR